MRRHVWVPVVAAWLGACAGTTDEPASSTASLELDRPPEVMDVVDERGERRLLRGPPAVGAPQTDERPTYRMIVEGDRERVEPQGRVLGGALVEGGVVWVTPARELVDASGAVLDRGVIPELAVSASGRLLAYPRGAGQGAGVYVIARDADGWSAPRRVTDALASADRPMFVGDAQLVVVGAVSSGIAGVWIVDAVCDGEIVPVTNAALRAGRPLGATFVPPPAYHASMRVEDGVLVYDDGRREQRVVLPAVGAQPGALR